MKDWTWQKWVGKLVPWAGAVATATWTALEISEPSWWPTIVVAAAALVQLVVSLIPAKE